MTWLPRLKARSQKNQMEEGISFFLNNKLAKENVDGLDKFADFL